MDCKLNGIGLIAEERARQMECEGWTPEHDDTHEHGELAITAACYAVHHTDASVKNPNVPDDRGGWPFDCCSDKRLKHDTLRSLVIAGALIAAEIDRIQRREARKDMDSEMQEARGEL